MAARLRGLGGVGGTGALDALGADFPITREWCRTWDEEPGDGGKNQFLCAEARLEQTGTAGEQRLRFAITGTEGYILTRAAAKREALQYWENFFEEMPTELANMNEQQGTNFRSHRRAAQYVLDTDGEFHGLDVFRETGDGKKARVWVSHSGGMLHDRIVEVFPELNWVIDWHLNDMRRSGGDDQWTYEALPAQLVEWMGRGAPLKDEHGDYRKVSASPERAVQVVRDAIRSEFRLYNVNWWNEAVVDLATDDQHGGYFKREEQNAFRANVLAVIYREYGIPDPYNGNATEEWDRIAERVGARLGIPGKVRWGSINAGVLYLAREGEP